MKRNFKLYLSIWAILLILFNVIAFVSVGWEGQEKYTASFWIGYVFITLTFIGQLISAYIAFQAENLRKMFYNIPLITISYMGLICSFVFGGACMIISTLPYWIGVIINAVILAVTAISVIQAKLAGDIVSELDDKVKQNTFFIRSLTSDAESLLARAKSEVAKSECKRIYEVIRYSDPTSNDVLTGIESQITIKFAEFTLAVNEDESDKVKTIADELDILLSDRNRKCKLLK